MSDEHYRLPDWACVGLTLADRVTALLTRGPMTRDTIVLLLQDYGAASSIDKTLAEMTMRGRVVRTSEAGRSVLAECGVPLDEHPRWCRCSDGQGDGEASRDAIEGDENTTTYSGLTAGYQVLWREAYMVEYGLARRNAEMTVAEAALLARRAARMAVRMADGSVSPPCGPICTCPASSEYDPPCPRHGVVGVGRVGP